jgi:hypothetical protein
MSSSRDVLTRSQFFFHQKKKPKCIYIFSLSYISLSSSKMHLSGAGADANVISQTDNFWQIDSERGIYTKVFPVMQRNVYTLLKKTGKYL